MTVTPEAACLAVLFVAFPSGVNEPMKQLYLEQLRNRSYSPDVLAEAAQRIIATREQRSVPPLAEILKRCDETRADFLKAEQGEEARQIQGVPWQPSEAHDRDFRAYRRLVLVYGVYWCRTEGRFVTASEPHLGCGHDPGTESGELWRPGLALETLEQAEAQEWERRPPPPRPSGDFASIGRVAEGLSYREMVYAKRERARP